jgi:AAA domain
MTDEHEEKPAADEVDYEIQFEPAPPDFHPFGIPSQFELGRWTPVPSEKTSRSAADEAESVLSEEKNPLSTGVFRFGQLMNLNVERPKDIAKGLFSERQDVLLMGRFGIGKTMLGTQFSLHLASGRDFLGLSVPRKFRTMYLDFENDLGDMKDRLAKQTEALKLSADERAVLDQNWVYVDAGDDNNPLHGIKLDCRDTKKLEPLINELIKHRPEVVFIDNLGLVATSGDLTDPEETARFYDNLKYIRSKVESLKDGAIVIFHHLTKPGEYQGGISLLTSPYEYLSRARGSGRILDFARSRLALAEETIGEKKCYVLNGINRSGRVSPLILQFNSDTLSFERHNDTRLRFDAVFGDRPRGKEIYKLLADEFKFSDAEKLTGTDGKKINKGTLSDTLRVAVENDFMRHNARTGVYTKIFDPQSD